MLCVVGSRFVFVARIVVRCWLLLCVGVCCSLFLMVGCYSLFDVFRQLSFKFRCCYLLRVFGGIKMRCFVGVVCRLLHDVSCCCLLFGVCSYVLLVVCCGVLVHCGLIIVYCCC